MSTNYSWNKSNTKPNPWDRTKSGKGPQWSLREFAADVGVPLSDIVARMSHPKHKPPSTEFRFAGACNKNSYYDLKELRAWWALETA